MHIKHIDLKYTYLIKHYYNTVNNFLELKVSMQ